MPLVRNVDLALACRHAGDLLSTAPPPVERWYRIRCSVGRSGTRGIARATVGADTRRERLWAPADDEDKATDTALTCGGVGWRLWGARRGVPDRVHRRPGRGGEPPRGRAHAVWRVGGVSRPLLRSSLVFVRSGAAANSRTASTSTHTTVPVKGDVTTTSVRIATARDEWIFGPRVGEPERDEKGAWRTAHRERTNTLARPRSVSWWTGRSAS